jgi:glutathione S-transferase
MPELTLTIGNKNYSSWSMRPWVLLTQAGIPFTEQLLRFDGFGPESRFKQAITRLSPVGRVPVLRDDAVAGGLVIWDSLAIAEYLAETFPEHHLWPVDPALRARARSLCAEMHAGFGALRSHCPMNIEASLPEVGARVLHEQAGVRSDLARLVSMWSELLEASGGPLLFGHFTVTDAMYAPVVMRLRTYALPVPPAVAAYMDRVVALPGVAAWINGALAEQEFLDFEEPYRQSRD